MAIQTAHFLSRFDPRAANPPKVNVRLDLEMGGSMRRPTHRHNEASVYMAIQTAHFFEVSEKVRVVVRHMPYLEGFDRALFP